MKRTMVMAALLLATTPALAQQQQQQQQDKWSYPPTKTVDVHDSYFGRTFSDPYRWLEDVKDPAEQAWFKAQARLTDDTLAKIPGRDALAQEWLALDKLKPASYVGIDVQGGRVFYKKTRGGENVGKLYYRQGWDGAEKLLFDPATFTPKAAQPGSVTTITAAAASPDGKRVALALSAGGAELSELRVLDVASGKLLADSIYPSYGAQGWLPDDKTFLYDCGRTADLKSPDFELHRMVKMHSLGAATSSDRDILSDSAHPELGIAPKEMPQVSFDAHDPAWLAGRLATVQQETWQLRAPLAALSGSGKVPWRTIATRADNLVNLVIDGNRAFALTHADAPNFKVVQTSVAHPDWAHAKAVVPETNEVITDLTRSKSYLFLTYSNGVTSHLRRYDLKSGKLADLDVPGGKGMVDIQCPDDKSNRCIVRHMSWIAPSTLYDYTAEKNTMVKSVFNEPVVYPGFDQLTVDEVEAPSHDGTLVPLSIIHRKDLKLDGSTPTILEGYGAYGISYTPYFSVLNSLALHGVVLAFAHVRGGGEKGERWYKAGYKATKPNTWKDFIACAEWLVSHKYTSPARLSGTGTSAGGVLISRAVTERPDLFAAAICNVGCANTLRMEFTPNGPVNTPEFGTVKDEKELAALAEMDGVSHVKPKTRYPAVMGVGGWNDPRVPPWQPGKFIAALQADSISGKPALMKVNYDNGHFTEEKRVAFKNFASQRAFLLWQTGHPEFQPAPSAAAREQAR